MIRSVELYDLVKTAFWFFWFRLRLRRLRSSKNWVVGVAKINHKAWERALWLVYPFAFASESDNLCFYKIVSDGVISGIGRKWKRSDTSGSDSVALMTAYNSNFWFSLGPHKRENQPLRSMRLARSIWCMTSSKRKISVFVRPHVNEKPAFSKIQTLKKKRCVFGDRFHGIRVDAI